jgi:hypothetical protein
MRADNLIITEMGWRLRVGWHKEIDRSDTYTALPRGYLMWDMFDAPVDYKEIPDV